MQYVQKLERGDPKVESGVIQEAGRADKVTRAVVAADLPPGERPHYQVIRTDSDAFAENAGGADARSPIRGSATTRRKCSTFA